MGAGLEGQAGLGMLVNQAGWGPALKLWANSQGLRARQGLVTLDRAELRVDWTWKDRQLSGPGKLGDRRRRVWLRLPG